MDKRVRAYNGQEGSCERCRQANGHEALCDPGCPDREERLPDKASLVPFGPRFPGATAFALEVFWATFGSYHPDSRLARILKFRAFLPRE